MTELAPINKVAVIITALEVETRAVLRLIGPWTDENVNGTSFFRGEFEGWDIAVAETGAGNVSAAAVTTRAIERYHPSVALFIGVGGGVKDGVLLGNVVVATNVYGYETGKDTATGFKTRPDAMVTAHEIQQRARVMRQRDDWKKRIDDTLQHQNLEILVGPIAAGEVVFASKCSDTAKFLKEHYGDALAVEM